MNETEYVSARAIGNAAVAVMRAINTASKRATLVSDATIARPRYQECSIVRHLKYITAQNLSLVHQISNLHGHTIAPVVATNSLT